VSSMCDRAARSLCKGTSHYNGEPMDFTRVVDVVKSVRHFGRLLQRDRKDHEMNVYG
jgi:hypothetical protein